MRWGLICGLILALHGGVAKADISVKEYREYATKAPAQLRIYVSGLQEGLFWAQTFYTSQNQRAIYCLPEKGLPTEEAFEILQRHIAEASPKDNDLIGLLFMKALSNAYPCPKK